MTCFTWVCFTPRVNPIIRGGEFVKLVLWINGMGVKKMREPSWASKLKAYWRQTLIELKLENMYRLTRFARHYSFEQMGVGRRPRTSACNLSDLWNDDAVENQRPFVGRTLLGVRGLLEDYLAGVGGVYDVDGMLDDLATYGGGRWWLPAVTSDVFQESLERRCVCEGVGRE